MEEFTKFLKANWIAMAVAIAIVLFAVAGVPLLINWSFTVPALCDFFAVDWEAKDALAYYGSALGFIGTAIFSGLALWQNHIIKAESDRRAQIAEQMELQKHLPLLSVEPSSCNGHGMNLSFRIRNLSENVARDVIISKISILNKDGSEFWISERELKYPHLGADDFFISLKNPALTSLEQVVTFRLSFKDKFDKYHTLLVEGKQMGTVPSYPKFFTKEI
ncbi:MAG: hypothetical protein IJX04_11140 [Oscillospiraceae bacterium]|nr:hypothetical protein [Oscillospiraceae bacterium]